MINYPFVGFVFDFDLTLVDTREENLLKARDSYTKATGSNEYPYVLTTLDAYIDSFEEAGDYVNWWMNYVGLTRDQMGIATEAWKDSQIELDVKPFDGWSETLHRLQNFYFSILSQNGGGRIRDVVSSNRWDDYFSKPKLKSGLDYPVIDFEGASEPKPTPDGIIKIHEQWGCPKDGVVFSIGDTSVDTEAALNAIQYLGKYELDVVTFGAFFIKGIADYKGWAHKADYDLVHPSDIIDVLHDVLPGKFYLNEDDILVQN